MNFDLFAQQAELQARLAEVSILLPVAGSFDRVDLTDEGAAAVAAQLVFLSFEPVDQTGRSALHHVHWSFDAYVDTARATDAERAMVMGAFSNAVAAFTGWDMAPGRTVRAAQGQASGFDGRVMRISYGFTVPVYLAGN